MIFISTFLLVLAATKINEKVEQCRNRNLQMDLDDEDEITSRKCDDEDSIVVNERISSNSSTETMCSEASVNLGTARPIVRSGSGCFPKLRLLPHPQVAFIAEQIHS